MFESIKKLFTEDFSKNNETAITNEKSKQNYVSDEKIDINIISIAPNSYLAQRAARICVGSDSVDSDIDKRLKFISKIASSKHESVLEHTNISFVLTIPRDKYEIYFLQINEVLCNSNYLYTSIINKGNNINILFGGTVRGFINIIRETTSTNFILNFIIKALNYTVEESFMESLFNDNIINNRKAFRFIPTNNEDGDQKDIFNFKDPVELSETNRVDLIYSTNVYDVYKKLKEYGFSYYDALKISIVSYIVHDISRSCGNQITRHRIAISQESQRYVTHSYDSNDYFVDPIIEQKNDRYKDLNKEVMDNLISKDKFETYNYLVSNGIMKEDARAYLPMNVKTRIMLTFTFDKLCHFLNLRTNKAAQLEVQKVANDMKFYIINGEVDLGLNNIPSNITEPFVKDNYPGNFGNTDFPYKTTLSLQEDNYVDEEILDQNEDEPKDLDISTLDKAKEFVNKNKI